MKALNPRFRMLRPKASLRPDGNGFRKPFFRSKVVQYISGVDRRHFRGNRFRNNIRMFIGYVSKHNVIRRYLLSNGNLLK